MKYFLFLFVVCLHFSLDAQIISEIMYNPPESGTDSLEYLEIYNNSNTVVDLNGFSLIGVSHSFNAETLLGPEQYLVIGKDSSALYNNFGVMASEWDAGALSNSGEDVGLINLEGDTIFIVDYQIDAPWPVLTNGNGSSIELCSAFEDYSLAESWNLSQGVTNNFLLKGTPGMPNQAVCQIRDYQELAISEILYEQPLWDTALQYVEFFNYGTETINLSSWSLAGDINWSSFPNVQLDPGEHYLIASDFISLVALGVVPDVVWAQSNNIFGDPFFLLTNPNGDEVVRLDFDSQLGFLTPMRGEAVELCDPSMNSNMALNWAIATRENDVNGNNFFGTPSDENSCMMIQTNTNDESDIYNSFSVSPNPVTTTFSVLSQNEISGIEIVDQQGSLVKVTSDSKNIFVTNLASGIYTLIIKTPRENIFKRLIKI